MKDQPRTLREARAYRYSVWAGNREGNPYREGYCIKEVFPNERGPVHRQCGGRGVPFCSIHKPGAQEARAANRPPTRFEREMAAIDQREQERHDMRRFKRALEKIAAMVCEGGHECAHDIASKALRRDPATVR